jgi:cytochrome P450
LDQRRFEPRDDLLSYLLAAHLDGEPLTDAERLGIARLLLIAGIDTTANALASAIWYLAQDTETKVRLERQPSLMPGAVEEFLRIFAPVSIVRGAKLDNTHIAFGSGVHRCLGAHFARMELRVGLEEPLAAIGHFKLADPASVAWNAGPIRGPKHLKLLFG